MRSPTLRAALALLLLSAWMALLFAGLAGGGAVHLLLLGAAGVWPWRAVPPPGDPYPGPLPEGEGDKL